jgi:hypothetical protein
MSPEGQSFAGHTREEALARRSAVRRSITGGDGEDQEKGQKRLEGAADFFGGHGDDG